MDRTTIRCVTINTHRGRGPKLHHLLSQASLEESRRIQLLHETRAYTYYMAEWLNQNQHRFDFVGLQEVFNGILGFGDKILGKFRQRDHYDVIGGFRSVVAHGVGFAGFRYENMLLSHLPRLSHRQINFLLPGRIFFLAACGFTLAPYPVNGTVVWIGNTHLHAYNPNDRSHQAKNIAAEIKKLGDVPILFLGDLNTVPPGCRTSDFPAGERDTLSYKNDRTLDILHEAGLRMIPHEDRDDFYTYPTGVPNRTLDYILFSKHWNVKSYGVLRDFKFSDHYPVYGEFELN